MNHLSLAPYVLGLVMLSACSGLPTQDDATNSSFATPDASLQFNTGLSQTRTNGLQDADGEGFMFQTGVRDGDGFEAIAGLIPGTDVSARPSTGPATYQGDYFVGNITDINLSSAGFLSGMQNQESGSMELNIDFASGGVHGGSDDGMLDITGELDGNELSGSVTYMGVGGNLEGLVGGDQAFGVFHGNSADVIFAGGFLADRP